MDVKTKTIKNPNGSVTHLGGLWKHQDSGKFYIETLLGEWKPITETEARRIIQRRKR